MYEWHEAVTTPPDEAIIWRYLSLTKYIDLLHRKQLYLCRLDKFDDPWEGEWTNAYKKRSPFQNDLDGEDGLINNIFKRQYFISCWHLSDHESVALWKIYSSENEGVAIKSTIGKLKASLQVDQIQLLHIGKVEYIDNHSTYEEKEESKSNYWGGLSEACKKRQYFDYEKEVRIIEDNDSVPRLQNSYANLDLQFIEEIRLSPLMGSVVIDTIKAVSEKFGVNSGLIKKSTIYEPFSHN